jgi:hypothetical protein
MGVIAGGTVPMAEAVAVGVASGGWLVAVDIAVGEGEVVGLDVAEPGGEVCVGSIVGGGCVGTGVVGGTVGPVVGGVSVGLIVGGGSVGSAVGGVTGSPDGVGVGIVWFNRLACTVPLPVAPQARKRRNSVPTNAHARIFQLTARSFMVAS